MWLFDTKKELRDKIFRNFSNFSEVNSDFYYNFELLSLIKSIYYNVLNIYDQYFCCQIRFWRYE